MRSGPDSESSPPSMPKGIVLPSAIIRVVAGHRLGGVEAMLLLYVVVRWPHESFGGGTIMRLDAAAVAGVLGVTVPAIDAAAARLAHRPLLELELLRGRRHVRAFPLANLIGGMCPVAGAPRVLELPTGAIERVMAQASRGRDAVVLLALLTRLVLPDPHVLVSIRQLSAALQIQHRSTQRIVARLIRENFLARVAGGFDLAWLLDGRATVDPTGGHPTEPDEGRTPERSSYRAMLADVHRDLASRSDVRVRRVGRAADR